MITPWIFECAVKTVELRPEVVSPEFLRTLFYGAFENRILVVIIRNQNPHTNAALVTVEFAGANAISIGMGASVIDVVDADVQVADRTLAAIVELEVLARHQTMEYAMRATFVGPAKNLGVKLARCTGVI